ncbi:hypothetical protein Tco_0105004 [Tanacetum coccineum]
MDYVKKSIEKRALHKMEYDSKVNERLMQITEDKVDSSKALDASLVDTESSGTTLKEQDTSSRSGNDAHVDVCTISGPTWTQSLVAKKKDISENRASRNFDLMITKWCLLKITLQAPFLNVRSRLITADQASVLWEMTSVHVVQCLCHGLASSYQMTSDHNRSRNSEFKTTSNEPSSSKKLAFHQWCFR